MTFRGLITLILLIGAILLGVNIYQSKAKNEQKATAQPPSSNLYEMTRQDGDTKLVFERIGTLQQSYMLFGIDSFSNQSKSRLSDGFVAGIPLPKAMDLLRQYPSMTRCGGAGSEKAKNAIQAIQLSINSDSMNRTLQKVSASFDSAMRRGDKRICLKIRGPIFKLTKIYRRDRRVDSGGDSMELVQPTELEMVPCI